MPQVDPRAVQQLAQALGQPAAAPSNPGMGMGVAPVMPTGPTMGAVAPAGVGMGAGVGSAGMTPAMPMGMRPAMPVQARGNAMGRNAGELGQPWGLRFGRPNQP